MRASSGCASVFGSADRREAGLPLAQQRARVAGGKAVFQILLHAEFDDSPIRKLTMQRSPKALAILESRASPGCVAIGRATHVDQTQDSRLVSEALDFQFQAPGPFQLDPGHAARDVARVIPSLDDEGVAARPDRESRTRDGERILAGFHENWCLAGFEKALNRQVSLARIGARGLPGCGLQWDYYGSPEGAGASLVTRAPHGCRTCVFNAPCSACGFTPCNRARFSPYSAGKKTVRPGPRPPALFIKGVYR